MEIITRPESWARLLPNGVKYYIQTRRVMRQIDILPAISRPTIERDRCASIRFSSSHSLKTTDRIVEYLIQPGSSQRFLPKGIRFFIPTHLVMRQMDIMSLSAEKISRRLTINVALSNNPLSFCKILNTIPKETTRSFWQCNYFRDPFSSFYATPVVRRYRSTLFVSHWIIGGRASYHGAR